MHKIVLRVIKMSEIKNLGPHSDIMNYTIQETIYPNL